MLTEECAICLGRYEAQDQVVELPCHHLFHVTCIVQWTNQVVACDYREV